MLNSFLWSWIFFLFWWPNPFIDQVFSPLRQVYFFQEAGKTRIFEIQGPLAPEKTAAILLERANPWGQVRAGIRTRPVFRMFFCDIDGDSEKEIVLGVSRSIKGMILRRVYLYHPTGRSFQARWLGSRLSYRLIDFDVISYKGSFALKSQESHGGKTYEGHYLWDQWGFRTINCKEIHHHE